METTSARSHLTTVLLVASNQRGAGQFETAPGEQAQVDWEHFAYRDRPTSPGWNVGTVTSAIAAPIYSAGQAAKGDSVESP